MHLPLLLIAGLALGTEPIEPEPIGVFINEIMYHPHDTLGDPDDYQWIELYNATDQILQLQGWTLNGFTLPQSRIAPHGFVVIARQDTSDPDGDGEYYSKIYKRENGFPHHQTTIIDAEDHDFGLLQPGQRVTLDLHDEEQVLRDEITYIESMGGNGDGPSLEKVVSFYPHAENLWRPSTREWRIGTPSLQNSAVAVRTLVYQEREEYERGEILRIVTGIINRSRLSISGILQTRAIDPQENERIIEAGMPFSIPAGGSRRFVQTWRIPDGAPEGQWLLKQVTRDQNQSVAPEIVEFTLGTVDETGSKSSAAQ